MKTINGKTKKEGKMKTHKFEMLLLEIRPNDSTHPQGNRVLWVTEFTKNGWMKIKGTPRFSKFALQFDHQTGIEENFGKVIGKKDGFFFIQLTKKSKALQWWG